MRRTLLTVLSVSSLALSSGTNAIAATAQTNTPSPLIPMQSDRGMEKSSTYSKAVNVFAGIVGTTPEAIQSALASGKTPEQIALDHGISKEQLLKKIDAVELNNGKQRLAMSNRFAELVQISPEQLQSELKLGKTPEEIALEHGISKEVLQQQYLVNKKDVQLEIQQRFAEKVRQGTMTQKQMDVRLKTSMQHMNSHLPWTSVDTPALAAQ